MIADYVTRGVKAGLVAGLVFGFFMAIVANPLVGYADEMNHAAATGQGDDAAGAHGGDLANHDESVVSTAVTKTVSVISAGLWAVLLGGVVFGIGFYFLEPAIPGTGAIESYLLGLAGFVTVSGAPWLVLPPVAPGAQQSIPVETRLPLYGGMMVAGALACVLSGYVYNRLVESNGRALATIGGLLPFGLLAVPAFLAPTNTVEIALSPELAAGLTGLFVFGQVLVWLLLASAHAQFASTDSSDAEIPTSSPGSGITAD